MPPSKDKVTKRRPAEPQWVGLLALFIGFAMYMIVFGILMQEIPNPLGMKGEGLLISLFFYLPVRIALRIRYAKKSKEQQNGGRQ